jgi:hypothetical protein
MPSITQKLLLWKAQIREMVAQGEGHKLEHRLSLVTLPRFAKEYLRGFRDGLKERKTQ